MTIGKAAQAARRPFLTGGGGLGGLIDTFDWGSTPIGPIDRWPSVLKTTIGLIVRSPVPIVTLWGEQGIMIYNDAYAVFAGARHPKLLGSPVREGWPEVADFNDNVMKVGFAGETLSYQNQELTLTRSGGPEQVWMNLDYSPISDEFGSPVGVMAVVVETTQGVKADNQLRVNQTRLQFLDALGKETAKSTDADTILAITTRMVGEHLGVTSCAYADMDADEDGFTIRGDWAAPGAVHIIGHYSLADFGKLAVERLSAGLPLIINDNLKEIAPEEAATFQSIGIGATICMPLVKEGRLTALMAIHHKAAHVWTDHELALITEVTERSWAHIERVRSEAEVRNGERRFREELERQVEARTADLVQAEKTTRTVFENSFMSQGLLTVDGRVIYVNATGLGHIDAKLADIVGKNYWETPWFTSTPGMPEKICDAVGRVAKGESVQFSAHLKLGDGNKLHEFSMRPAFDEAGQVVALVPEAIDVTARVRAEQALHQAQKIEALGSLTGGIAHDFNNLLMAVTGSLEMLRKRIPQDEKLFRLVDNALEGARRGKSLTERMLAFARRQELQPERISLSKLVHGMAELMERSLGPTIRVDIDIPDDLPFVEVDPNQLESAILNLALNARDAMGGEGPLRIYARTGVPTSSEQQLVDRFVCLTVEDQGEGMDERTLKRATEPFFTTKGVGRGTGLGLSMVQGMAEQSGGNLCLTSKPGQGTTAELLLPAVDPAIIIPEASPVREKHAEQRGSPLNVLVVDDDPLVLSNTSAMLEDLGHSVVAVDSGDSAIDALKLSRFDLMLTDHAMPRMTGAQLVREVGPLHPEMSVIIASGFAEIPEDMNPVTRLKKPYSQAELAEALAASCTPREPKPTSDGGSAASPGATSRIATPP
jgi:signal transduction histidine kinase/CheY-like chemotaxis protein